MARDYELPPDALALLAQVSALEERLNGLREDFDRDVERARVGIEVELRRLFEAQQKRTPRDGGRSAFRPDLHEIQDALSTDPQEVQTPDDQVTSLREQVRVLESSRDALLEAGRRRIAAERQEMLDSLATKERQQAFIARSATQGLDRRSAELTALFEEKKAALERDRAALSAVSEGRSFQLTGLLAEAWADYVRLQAQLVAAGVSPNAGGPGRGSGSELAKARRRAVQAEWVVRLYEEQVPWLPELRDREEEQSYVASGNEHVKESAPEGEPDPEAEFDPVRRWLTAEEWRRLPTRERNQRALDRYFARGRTPWQLGRDYERYVGYRRESEGYRVTYQGMIAGLEDMGRDLIAFRGNDVEVIQCKRWSQNKTIHEKHVFQLYGTYVLAALEHPGKNLTASFVTTTQLSELARRVAHQLGVRVIEQFAIDSYPAIKCNVGRDGERIYHLPFDQQYDRTIVHSERGEFWAATIAEAEAAGFRRALRWTQDR